MHQSIVRAADKRLRGSPPLSPGGVEEHVPHLSHSLVPAVVRYIGDQEKHHRRVTFEEELIAFLKKNGIAYDERYIWS